MDHYNEQLVTKKTETKDIILRVLIIAATVVIIGITVFGAFLFRFLPLIVI